MDLVRIRALSADPESILQGLHAEARQEAQEALAAVGMIHKARALLPELKAEVKRLQEQLPEAEKAILRAQTEVTAAHSEVVKLQGQIADLAPAADRQRADWERLEALQPVLQRAINREAQARTQPSRLEQARLRIERDIEALQSLIYQLQGLRLDDPVRATLDVIKAALN